MSAIENTDNQLQELSNKITYTIERKWGFIHVTAHLPEGFTMPTFTRMFRMDNKPKEMTEQEYIIKQQEEMFSDLTRRIKHKSDRLLK